MSWNVTFTLTMCHVPNDKKYSCGDKSQTDRATLHTVQYVPIPACTWPPVKAEHLATLPILLHRTLYEVIFTCPS